MMKRIFKKKNYKSNESIYFLYKNVIKFFKNKKVRKSIIILNKIVILFSHYSDNYCLIFY